MLRMTGPVRFDRDAAGVRCTGPLSYEIPEGALDLVDGLLGGWSVAMPGLTDRGAHVLLVNPRVEYPDLHEASVVGLPYWCP